MERTQVLLVAMGVLVLFAIWQAVQISAVKGEVEAQQALLAAKGGSGGSAASDGMSDHRSGSSLPSNIANLPQQVGGC